MSLIITKMQIKTTRYYLTPVRLAIINKSTTKKVVGKNVKKREPSCTVGGNADDEGTVENSMEVPQRIKNGTALWPSNSTSGNIYEETQNTHLKEYVHIYIHYGIIYNKHILETTQVPVNR